LRELFQAFVHSKGPGNHLGCPSVQDLADSFDPKTSMRKKKEIIDHLSECGDCREDFRLYLELNKFGADPRMDVSQAISEKAHRALGLSLGSLWRYVAIAVALGLVLAGLVFLRRGEIPEVERNPAKLGIVLVQPLSGTLGPDDIVFRWKELASAQHYILEMFDGTLLPIWVSPPLRETETELPKDIARTLKAGASYYWMVSGYSASSKIAESRLARFKVSEGPRPQNHR
ncbi:MAG TPA: hypothetical protein VLJ16_07160, partial [Acidobacteriota bacterium]|nr:hypothetical protein [Acidobacteriota bacterium]